MNFKHASNSRALASPTRVMASGSCSSILRSIWSSLYLAILDREKSQARTVREKIPDIENRIAGNQAAPNHQRQDAQSPAKTSLRAPDGRGRASAARRAEGEQPFVLECRTLFGPWESRAMSDSLLATKKLA